MTHTQSTLSATAPTGPAIRVEGLTKRFGDRAAVDGLDFELPRGAVAGFIGPNGAGKTTTMAMLLGLVEPTSGEGEVLGHPLGHPASYLPRVGALIEGPAFYPGLSGVENLRVLAAMGSRDPSRIPAILDQVGLGDRATSRFREYSMGMKQRLGIAGALLGDPDLLVLDEPTNGLDPIGMREIRDLIGEIASEGRTVLVSSHLLGEMEQVCDWLIVIERGAGIYSGPAKDFLADAPTAIVTAPEHAGDLEPLRSLLAAEGYDVEPVDGHLSVSISEGDEARTVAVRINRVAHEHGVVLAELRPRRANLESRYLSLVDGGIS